MTVKKLALMAVLTAVALIIFIIEALIPIPIPIPGVKLGLANAVTLFALFYSSTGRLMPPDFNTSVSSALSLSSEIPQCQNRIVKSVPVSYLTTINAFAILMCRIILGALFTGRVVAFAYSITGGLLGFAAQVVAKRFVTDKQIWVCGAIGAVFHNIGQILAAIFITGTPAIVTYLPVLIISGIFTGVITGLIAQFTLARIPKAAN